jgi:hypothetical protein
MPFVSRALVEKGFYALAAVPYLVGVDLVFSGDHGEQHRGKRDEPTNEGDV